MKTNYVLRLLLFLLVIIQSCQKDSSLHENTSQSDKLLERSKKYYSGQLRVRTSADSNDINIKLYQPDWSKVAYTKTKQGYDLLAVPLKQANGEHTELNIIAKEDNIYGVIKRYTDGKLYLYSGSGRLKNSGTYDRQTKTFKPEISTMFSTMDFDGGELDEVIIDGGTGGGDGGDDGSGGEIGVTPAPVIPDGGGGGDSSGGNLGEPTDSDIADYISEMQAQALLNKLCPQSFNFTNVVMPNGDGAGWKEASLKDVVLQTMSDSYFEAIWSTVTTGTPIVTSQFNLEIGLPGDLPAAHLATETAKAANDAMRVILTRYKFTSIKRFMQYGTFPTIFANQLMANLSTVYGATRVRVSTQLSGRTTPNTPINGLNCQ